MTARAWALRCVRDPLMLVRVGLCLVMLLRHEDFLRGIVAFEHYEWGPGPEFGPQSLARIPPQFAPPLLPGLDALLPWSGALCRVRLALTCLLLIGVLPRLNAFLLASVSLGLLAADGFRYLHHLLVLYVSLLFLAFSHDAEGRGASHRVPFALLVLRAHVLVVYVAAGLAKLNHEWLSGQTIEALARNRFVTGALFEATVKTLGAQGLSVIACSSELVAPLLLAFPKTRRFGAALALGLHGFIHETMLVSTFGGTMVVLLLSFLPCAAERPTAPSASEPTSAPSPRRSPPTAPWRRLLPVALIAVLSPVAAFARGTSVGSYTMFTRLVHYELALETDGAPLLREELADHLGRDGARIVRLANGRGIGETNVHVLRQALPDLGAFVCKLRPSASWIRLELTTRRIEGGVERLTTVETRCGSLTKSPRTSEWNGRTTYLAGRARAPSLHSPRRALRVDCKLLHVLPLRVAHAEQRAEHAHARG